RSGQARRGDAAERDVQRRARRAGALSDHNGCGKARPGGLFRSSSRRTPDPFREVTGSVMGPGFRRGDEVEAPRIPPRSARKLERLVHVQIVAGVH
ncbi:hypothetical protein ABTK44_19455, partial [Acinetobacter baumannii]